MKQIRIGVLGCGYWGPNHIRNFSALAGSGAVMAMAADRDEARRKHIGELYPSVRLVEDGQEVIDDPDIDAVIVATPVASHYPLSLQALEAGKHILLEKPAGTEIEDCRTLQRIARENRLTVQMGYQFRYTPPFVFLRTSVLDGLLGDVFFCRSRIADGLPH